MDKKNFVTLITLTLGDGSTLEFIPKNKTSVKILRGTMEHQVGNMVERSLNNKEAIIIVNAPEDVQWLFRDDGDLITLVKERLNS